MKFRNNFLKYIKRLFSFNLVIFITVITFFAILFYWFGIRQAKIRSECSWVKKHSDATPLKPAMTEEELWSKGLLEKCEPINDNPFLKRRNENCKEENQKIINQYKQIQPEIPAKDWHEKTTKKEYEFCLRSKGMRK